MTARPKARQDAPSTFTSTPNRAKTDAGNATVNALHFASHVAVFQRVHMRSASA